MEIWKYFHGPNAGYVLELYDAYKENPDQFDPSTRAFFEQLPLLLDEHGNGHSPALETAGADVAKIMGVVNYANAIREYGHLAAHLDPLGSTPPGDPELDPAYHNLTEADLRSLPARLVDGPIGERAANAYEATQMLRRVYSSRIGYDYDHIRLPAEREWLKLAAEMAFFHPENRPIDGVELLHRLTEIEVFEDFLQRTFPSKYRFSIEGLDMMVPILDEAIRGWSQGRPVQNILIGMAHRGRLNVMAHVLHRPYQQILAEFIDDVTPSDLEIKLGWTGDVKYHRGETRIITNAKGEQLKIAIPPNPSHLEAVNAVAVGMARAAGTHVDERGEPTFDPDVTMTILIHGDAAFSGQGVVAETFNLSQLPGYWVGGTVHIIANNQVGFTTNPNKGRSTLYASDLAKGFKVPVVHVNADDPEACIEVARLAADYVAEFRKDFVIDLIGYRRYGHNELDEPRFTQPLMYQRVREHPPVRQLWTEELIERGQVTAEEAEQMVTDQRQTMQDLYSGIKEREETFEDDAKPELPPEGKAKQTNPRPTREALLAINQSLRTIVEPLSLLRNQRRGLTNRRDSVEANEPGIDWATAEELALATILAAGIAVRMTGQDVERGTFSHRHAVLHDLETGAVTIPLQAFEQASAAFEIHNSPLSEAAALGFEYGYNAQRPERLVVWEAQFGDFVNNAQVVVDEFITAARAKWGQTPSLVLLLPHGYEGKGPDHSSGRLERFLQLAAKTNIRVTNPTLPAQYFHLLRRQAALLNSDPLPLIVMAPKSLLRRPDVVSSLGDLVEGSWQPVIDDPRTKRRAAPITRLILCSGKFYYDLIKDEKYDTHDHVAIARVEQLYPFPVPELEKVISRYKNLEQIVWAQEEPKNMGAWDNLSWRLERLIDGQAPLDYVGRRRISSPAEGSATLHKINQQTIIDHAYTWRR